MDLMYEVDQRFTYLPHQICGDARVITVKFCTFISGFLGIMHSCNMFA